MMLLDKRLGAPEALRAQDEASSHGLDFECSSEACVLKTWFLDSTVGRMWCFYQVKTSRRKLRRHQGPCFKGILGLLGEKAAQKLHWNEWLITVMGTKGIGIFYYSTSCSPSPRSHLFIATMFFLIKIAAITTPNTLLQMSGHWHTIFLLQNQTVRQDTIVEDDICFGC